MIQFIYGKNAVSARVRAGRPIRSLYLVNQFDDKSVMRLLEQTKTPYTYRERGVLDRLTVNQLHQGIVAEIEGYETLSLEQLLMKKPKNEHPFYLVLDKIEDPHNVGAILRTAEAVGLDAIIVPTHGSAPLNSTVSKVSTGAIEFVTIVEVTNITQSLKKLKEKGFWIVGAENAPHSVDYRSIDYKMPVVLVVGSEGFGITRLVKEQCDYLVHIPMLGIINSLNASVATAICLYQIWSSRNPL